MSKFFKVNLAKSSQVIAFLTMCIAKKKLNHSFSHMTNVPKLALKEQSV